MPDEPANLNIPIYLVFREAAKIAGYRLESADAVESAFFQLHTLLGEWSNRGMNLWEVQTTQIAVEPMTTQYDLPIDCTGVIEVIYKYPGGGKRTLTRNSYVDWFRKTETVNTDAPLEFAIDKQAERFRILFYPIPDAGSTIDVLYIARQGMQHSMAGSSPVPSKWTAAMIAGLAYKMCAIGQAEDKVVNSKRIDHAQLGMLRDEAERQFIYARHSDSDISDLRIRMMPGR